LKRSLPPGAKGTQNNAGAPNVAQSNFQFDMVQPMIVGTDNDVRSLDRIMD